MSRIGKLPVVIANGVTVTVKDREVKVSGPKGDQMVAFPQGISVKVEAEKVIVACNSELLYPAWGTTRALINNAVIGVSTGWTKSLEMVGVGFKSVVKGQILEVTAGYSHVVPFAIPEGITATVEANTKITLSGNSKNLVGQTAAKIRKIRKPEPYKGKGIKYVGEIIRRKAGKSGKAGASK